MDLGPVREQALLAALLLRPGRTVSRRQLLDGVWGSEPPGTGAKVIPVYVHRLRRRLDTPGRGAAESLLVTARGGYCFAPANTPGGARVDVVRCAELAAEGRAARDAGDLAAAATAWSAALGLYRGEPLASVPGPFAEGERLRLTEQRLTLAQELASARLRLGRHAEAVGELYALAAEHPYHEALAALLMRALYAANRQSDALDVYAAVRRRLVDEQGVEPGAELRQAHEAVLRGDPAPAPQAPRPAAPAPPPARPRRQELPVDIGRFTGRDRELGLLLAPAEPDVVTVRTVDGMAGIGKTALAVHAARKLSEGHPDGCLFVELHGHREDHEAAGRQRVLRRLLRSVGAGEGEDSEDLDELAASWRAATAGLRLLLVLDDASAAEQVRPLLPAGPGSMVLVTSRQRLTGLDADRRISLAPLGLDEAAGLLTRIVGGEGSARERAAVRELAALCDRLPLALRIVGARIQDRPLWAVEALAARLTDGERRLDELAVEDRSVEVAFQLSYGQLPPGEQRAFRALGLSPTVQFDRLALAALLGRTPAEAEQALQQLADASLVQQVTADRYRLHDLMAVYARRVAATRPDEAAAARERVFRLYVTAARCASDWGTSVPGADARDTGPFTDWEDAAAWLDAAGAELVDVIGQSVAAGQHDDACRLAEGLVDYLTRQGRFHECRTALETALPFADRSSEQRFASALRTGMGIMYGLQGRYRQARDWFTQALDLSRRADDPHEQARASAGLGTFANLEGDAAESMTHFAEVARLVGSLEHDDWLMGSVMTRVGDIHHQLGEHDKAYDRYTDAIALAERSGSPRLLGKTLLRLGRLQLDLDRPAEAAGALGKAEDLARRLGDVPLHSAVLDRLATAESRLGNPQAAAELRRRARALLDEQTGTESEIVIRHQLVWYGAAAEDLAGARDFFARSTNLPGAEANRARISRVLDALGRRGRGSQEG
ncbi:AfsR/SARP family transcriptional regulator [Streptomyces cavernicola]|uniref:BTAD domain-containing putative transcriptional regulator n=1 Tax=Streptomyces cavernicola TaxID=3043613 RepID=A0ABT6SIK2_9ACTN|nr:BTAD domain-containing putative transcriptional regulator [Streptomyces sp. B-S-A6]MDI3408013.1 BTAD domain-containing putative transcriptional regulator [Streptomyces sp. B-S-A6]